MNAILDQSYERQEFPLGDKMRIHDAEYIFCKFNAGDIGASGVAGQLVVALDSAYERFEVTCHLDSSTIKAINAMPVGILQAAVDDGDYVWVQFAGKGRKDITTDGAITQGMTLMASTTSDVGLVVQHDASAVPMVGVALETDDASTAVLDAGEYYLTLAL